jgi:hypothetical protein
MVGFAENHIQNCQRRFEETGNPIWVWHAIWVCGGGLSGDKYSLPDWCLEYLFASAARVESLWSRKEFDPASKEGHERLTWDEALSLLPSALGLRRQGFNSLKSADADESDARLAVKYDLELAGEGLSRAQALEQLRSETNLDEARLRKRLTSGRKLAGSKQQPARKPSRARANKPAPELSIEEWMDRNPLPEHELGSEEKPKG